MDDKPQEPYGTFHRDEETGEYIRIDGTILDPLLAQAMNDVMKDFQASKQFDVGPIEIMGFADDPEKVNEPWPMPLKEYPSVK